jgi:hypothetical protein
MKNKGSRDEKQIHAGSSAFLSRLLAIFSVVGLSLE